MERRGRLTDKCVNPNSVNNSIRYKQCFIIFYLSFFNFRIIYKGLVLFWNSYSLIETKTNVVLLNNLT